MTALVAHGLRVTYGDGTRAVDGIDLEVNPGELVSLVGASGAGKSSLVTALLGLHEPPTRVDADRLELDGVDLRGARERDWRRMRGSRVARVPQDPLAALNPNMRIGAQIAEAVRSLTPDAPVDETVARLCDEAQLAGADVLHAHPHELSGGQRQRVLMAIALAGSPRLLIADEPTSALDRVARQRILDRLRALASDDGRAVLLVTHDLESALALSDRVEVMHEGRLVDPVAHPHARALREAARALSLRDGDRRGAPNPDARELVRFNDVAVVRARRGPRGATRTVAALDGVTLGVPAGETLGIVGESGAGKTTLLRVGLGLVPPTAGSVTFDGVDLAGLGRRELRALRRRFQLVQQDPAASLDPRRTVAESIAEPLRAHGVGSRADRGRRVAELLDQVRLHAAMASKRPRELSGGQQQRVALARALALKPELIYLDEPVSALDTEVQAEVLRLLIEVQRELGITYLFVSHDLGAVARISHRIAVFRAGRLVEVGPAN
ncbi:ABC transporter ATP-binding protein [Gulosibacter faecalis]|uniref:ABC transporter ATP-binding protein n=1 Tax=Gulosibacter faecalis TaxID=272240 RepID=A0ABW5UVQ8_9MICO|nr:ABC transporter ATP-binding protein [Gulosibacter faecalis]